MKINKLLRQTAKMLEKYSPDSFDIEAEILLAAVIKKNREYIYSHPEDSVTFWQKLALRRLIARRQYGYSITAIIGHKWFYGLDFIVNKNVLIPRPETELIVEEVIKLIKNEELRIKNVVDVGTGSGCVVIALAKNLKKEDAKFYGLDISRKALAVARKNAEKNGVSGCIKFIHSDLLDGVDKNIFNEPAIITANLPYLTPEQVKNSPSIQKEPKLALLAGDDGLDCYRRLFTQIKNREIKNKLIIFCEIDETQKDSMAELIKQSLPQAELEFKNDLGGHCRLTIIKFK